jgi:hypothetical protein
MKPLQITGGHIHAPYFIFIDGGSAYTDEEVMKLLGIEGFNVANRLEFPNQFLHITNNGQWLHLADDWLYSQWHSKSIRDRIVKLAATHDIFTCSVGDADHSFDFEYYRDGKLIRHYVVEDMSYDGGQVTKDFGEPLPGEVDAFRHNDEIDRVLAVARSIGIVIDHTPENIRSFTKSDRTFSRLLPNLNHLRTLLGRK